jgi:hypothetical protein
MPTDETVKTQIGENLRFYSDMRFKQLTLLMAWLTFAGFGAYNYGSQKVTESIELRALLSCISVFFTAVLWVMEVRSTIYWDEHRSVVPELWPLPPRAFWKFLSATNAVITLYASMFGLWVWLGHIWGVHDCFTFAFIVLWVMLIIFTIVNFSRQHR